MTQKTCEKHSVSRSLLSTVTINKLWIPCIAPYQHIQSGEGAHPGISLRLDEEHRGSGFDHRWCVSASMWPHLSAGVSARLSITRTARMCQVDCQKVSNLKSSRQCLCYKSWRTTEARSLRMRLTVTRVWKKLNYQYKVKGLCNTSKVLKFNIFVEGSEVFQEKWLVRLFTVTDASSWLSVASPHTEPGSV